MVRFTQVLLSTFLGIGSLRAGEPAAPEGADQSRKAINLEALSRLKGLDLEANPAIRAVVLRLLEQVRGTPQFVQIVRDFKLKGQEAGLLEVAAKEPSGPSAAEAIRLVLNGGDVTLLKQSLGRTNGLSLIEALGNTGEKEIVPLLQPLVLESVQPLAVRQRAVRAIAKVQEGAATLIELARTRKLPDDLRATASLELHGVPWSNLKAQATQWLPTTNTPTTHALPPISELVKMRGDPAQGAAVFKRETVGCFKCHQVNGQGTDFGPNLSEIGAKLAKSALYESILDPSAGIAFGYEAWQLEFANGDEALGLIVSETVDEVALKAVGGIVTRYKKAEITHRVRQKLSIMPAGLEQTMSLEDLSNLVEYLASLKKAAR